MLGRAQQFVQGMLDNDFGDCCVIWPYAHNPLGYGVIRIGNRNQYVHRHIFCLANGRSTKEKFGVAHSCGVSACVNPKHLRAATQHENVMDTVRMGRQFTCHGSDNKKAKLTEEQVREIRRAYEINPELYRVIAERYGVRLQAIHNLIKRKTWKHVE
jgi:bisphosphoglycerate-dependent phosphoglycerate mutase